jgi:hypothetical protein
VSLETCNVMLFVDRLGKLFSSRTMSWLKWGRYCKSRLIVWGIWRCARRIMFHFFSFCLL